MAAPTATDTPARPACRRAGRLRRVLMVAYEFPPLATGGVNRTLKFTRYLPQFGWQPFVLTVANPAEAPRDPSRLDQVPACARVYRTRSWEHHVARDFVVRLGQIAGLNGERLRDGLNWRLRGIWDLLAVPDLKIYWAAPAVVTGVAAALWQGIDAVYSTSWPYSDHLAGLAISQLTGRPFIADFRDPWTQHMNHGRERRGWDRRQRTLERLVCAKARFVITPTRCATRALSGLMSHLPREKFVTIRNGFDPDDFTEPTDPLPRFEIVHAGTFHKSRQPDVFLQGLAKFLSRVPEARRHTRLRLFGTSLDSDLTRLADQECVELHGWTAHRDVVRAFYEASVLLLIQHGEEAVRLTIPGKAYELLATGRHVLGIQILQRELAAMLRAYGHSTLVRRHEPGPIAEALEALYRRWRRGELAPRAPAPMVQRFSRIEATRQLASLLNCSVGAAAVRPLRRRPAEVRSQVSGMTASEFPAVPAFQEA